MGGHATGDLGKGDSSPTSSGPLRAEGPNAAVCTSFWWAGTLAVPDSPRCQVLRGGCQALPQPCSEDRFVPQGKALDHRQGVGSLGLTWWPTC